MRSKKSPDVPFVWLLPLTGLGATESGVDRHVIGVVAIVSTLVPIASELAAAVLGFSGARIACIIVAMG